MIIFLTTVVIQKKRKLILSTQTITFFSISYYHYTTGELYARRKKSSRSKVNNKIKRKKNPFFSLPSYLPFFLLIYIYCMCVLPIHQSSISITSSVLASQLNLIYIKLISNKKKEEKKKKRKVNVNVKLYHTFEYLFSDFSSSSLC